MEQKLLHKYIAGDANPQEKETVIRWIEADKKNMEEFLSARKLYDLTVWQNDLVTETYAPAGRLRKICIEFAKIAAIFIGSIILVTIFYPANETVPEETGIQKLYVPAGQRAELTLSDGTKVWLNAKTTFSFPDHFNDHQRNVILDGEAYFDVAHNEKSPFVIQTEKYNVKVLGTEFNVRAYKEDEIYAFETALINGSVEIETADHAVKKQLQPKEKAYAENGQLEIKPITEFDQYLWKEGLICFDDNNLAEIFKKLDFYYNIPVKIENTKILDKRYTGKFRSSDGIEHILKTLQLKTKFRYERKEYPDNIIVIK